MPSFKFTITRDTSESAQVVVTADTIEQAQETALTREFESTCERLCLFATDDGAVSDTYLPDETDYEEIDELPAHERPSDHLVVEAARYIHGEDGSVEIDDNAPVSRARSNPENGAYVQAWVWVSDEAAKEV